MEAAGLAPGDERLALTVLLGLAITLSLAGLSYVLIERPCLQLTSRLHHEVGRARRGLPNG
jgi:peptidoglycan/LPS O-acetylase OafA/YrhL